MQIDITELFNNTPLRDYSASNAELGEGVGALTWDNAKEDCGAWLPKFIDSELDALRKYFKSFGAWSEEEIASWTVQELCALLLQFIAGDIRASGIDTTALDWEAYETGAYEGAYSGAFYKGDDGRVYYYVGD